MAWCRQAPAGIPLTNPLGENRQFSLQIMFILRSFNNSAIVLYFLSKFACRGISATYTISHFDQTVVKSEIFGILRQYTMKMHAAGLMGIAPPCGPATCMNHQFTVATQAWCGDPQQPERHSLAQTKYDVFVTLTYYRELPELTALSDQMSTTGA